MRGAAHGRGDVFALRQPVASRRSRPSAAKGTDGRQLSGRPLHRPYEGRGVNLDQGGARAGPFRTAGDLAFLMSSDATAGRRNCRGLALEVLANHRLSHQPEHTREIEEVRGVNPPRARLRHLSRQAGSPAGRRRTPAGPSPRARLTSSSTISGSRKSVPDRHGEFEKGRAPVGQRMPSNFAVPLPGRQRPIEPKDEDR